MQCLVHYLLKLICFEAKLLFHGHCLLDTCQRFIRDLVPEAPLDHDGLGLTKPATFPRLWSPGHERTSSCIHKASLMLQAMIIYRATFYIQHQMSGYEIMMFHCFAMPLTYICLASFIKYTYFDGTS